MTKTVFAVLTCLVLAACGAGEPADTTTQTTEAEMVTTAPPTTAAPTTAAPDTTSAPDTTAAPDTTSGESSDAAATIAISGFSFGAPLTVSVGDTVEVINNDTVPHTWTADNGAFNASLGPDARTTFTFDEAGEYTYFCALHPSMQGVVTVEG